MSCGIIPYWIPLDQHRGLLLSRGFLDYSHDVIFELFVVILILSKVLHPFCDSLLHSRYNLLLGTVIEFGIGIGILRLQFSSISLIRIFSPFLEFFLL